jgi:hypothetical protein
MNKRQQMTWSLEGANAIITVRVHYRNQHIGMKIAA